MALIIYLSWTSYYYDKMLSFLFDSDTTPDLSFILTDFIENSQLFNDMISMKGGFVPEEVGYSKSPYK